MSIENTLERLALAAEGILAALNGGAAAASKPAAAPAAGAKAAAPAAASKPAAKAPKHTREELSALAGEYKEKTSKEDAKALIKKLGKVDLLKELPEGKIDEVYDGITAAITALDEAGEPATTEEDI